MLRLINVLLKKELRAFLFNALLVEDECLSNKKHMHASLETVSKSNKKSRFIVLDACKLQYRTRITNQIFPLLHVPYKILIYFRSLFLTVHAFLSN